MVDMNSRDIKKQQPEKECKKEPNKVQILLDGLAKGECKGVKGATVYKIAEYAQKKGLV